MIHLTAISHRYPGSLALDQIDLTINEGECVALIGPTGAGKSTLLKLLAGRLPLSSGSGSVMGFDLKRESHMLRSRVGWLPSSLHLWSHLTARSMLSASAHFRGVSSGDFSAQLAQWDAWFELHRFIDQPLSHLSKGQQRKVALCQWLMTDHAIGLLDDPTEGLDPVDATLLGEFLKHHARGRTLVVAGHQVQWLASFAQRIVALNQGRIRSDDSLAGTQKSAPDHLRISLILKAPMEVEEIAEAATLLKALPQVNRLEHEVGSLEFVVYSKPGQDAYPAIRELLLSTDWPVTQFTQSTGSLGHLYRPVDLNPSESL